MGLRLTERCGVWLRIAVLAAGGMIATAALAETSETDPFATTPVLPELAVDGVTVVGGEIVATMAVMARESLADVQIRVELPAGVELSAGEPSWNGPMAAGEIRIVEVSAKLVKAGRRLIIGRVVLAGGAPTPTVLTTDQQIDVKPSAPAATPRTP
jgi:hypothetical protein